MHPCKCVLGLDLSWSLCLLPLLALLTDMTRRLANPAFRAESRSSALHPDDRLFQERSRDIPRLTETVSRIDFVFTYFICMSSRILLEFFFLQHSNCWQYICRGRHIPNSWKFLVFKRKSTYGFKSVHNQYGQERKLGLMGTDIVLGPLASS